MSFQTSKYLVQDCCYPRYEYSVRNVVSMYKRYRVLLNDLKLENRFEIPVYGDAEVYVIRNSKTSGFVDTQHLVQRENDEGEAVKEKATVPFKDIATLVRENQIMRVSAKVVVKELNDVHENVEQWIAYHENVILVAKDDNILSETKLKLGEENNGLTLSTSETLGKDICLLLERIVFRKLSELVPELKCLSEVAQNECHVRGFEDEMSKRTGQMLRNDVCFKAWMKEMDPEWCKPQTSSTPSKTLTKQTSEAKHEVEANQPAKVAAESLLCGMEKGKFGVHLTEKFAAHMVLKANQHIDWRYKTLPSSFRCMLPKDIQEKAVLSDGTFDKILNAFSMDLKKHIPDKTIPGDVENIRKAFWKARKDIVSCLTRLIVNEDTFRLDDWIALVRSEEETSIRRMLWEITGMYNRSKVPEAERPKSPCFQGNTLNEKAAQHLFNSVNTAKGIGYRCDKLHIFVDAVDTKEEHHKQNKQIKDALAKYHITDFTISPTTKIVQHYKQVGAKIRVTRSGTLGGFAYMGQNKQLCALLSKHVVNGAKAVYWINNEQGVKIGSMVEAMEQQADNPGNIEGQETVFVDVAAAEILAEHVNQCDTRFRDSRGRARPCTLYEKHDPADLAGLRVHIRGATTNLGRGTITAPEYYVQGMTRLILIEDIREENGDIVRFSQEGDSGAVICADHPDGDSVDVISMLIGIRNWKEVRNDHRTSGQYMTFRMDHGLQELKRECRENFTLVNS